MPPTTTIATPEKAQKKESTRGFPTALANLSSSISLDSMLSSLVTTTTALPAEGSEHGSLPRSLATKRSVGRTSVVTRGSMASRIDTLMDDNIRTQADMEALSYGRNHPSGVASEGARRARAAGDAMKDASARVATYNQRFAANRYSSNASLRGSSRGEDTPRSCCSSYTPRSSATTPRGTLSSRASTPSKSTAARSAGAFHASSPSPRAPRSTELGPVFVSPRSERMKPRERTLLPIQTGFF